MKSPDSVTVLVFKDNYASRSFQVPLRWFSRLGMLMGLLMGAVLITAFFALKFYRLALANGSAGSPAVAPIVASAPSTASGPVPTVTVTVTSAPVAQAAPAPVAPAKELTVPAPAPAAKTPTEGMLFTALPAGTLAPPADASKIPIAVKNASFSWSNAGRKLAVKFDVQYVAEDKGTQQGRIILLARGPEVVFAYPNGALNKGQSAALVDPAKGEFFSVSRLRNTVAEFGPLPAKTSVTEIEAIILSSTGQLLIHDIIPVDLPKTSHKAPKAAEPAADPAAAPGAEAAPPAPAPVTGAPEKPLEPGYDQ